MSDRYTAYPALSLESPADGILKITFNKPESFNSVDAEAHTQLTSIWRDIDADPSVRAVLVTGAGKAFSAGGDFSLVEENAATFEARAKVFHEARDLVAADLPRPRLQLGGAAGLLRRGRSGLRITRVPGPLCSRGHSNAR